MTPGKRKHGREHWPNGLQQNDQGYWYYLRPDLPRNHPDKRINIGRTHEGKEITYIEAADVARQFNSLYGCGGPLANKIMNQLKPQAQEVPTSDQIPEYRRPQLVSDYIDRMVNVILPARKINGEPLSQRYLQECRRHYRNIKSKLGDYLLTDSEMTHQVINSFLLEIGTTPEVFNMYRLRLVDMYKHARSEGIQVTNFPEMILQQRKGKKKRQQIMLPGDKPGEFGLDPHTAYQAIFDQASFPVQCAMDLSLNALQRRNEVQSWRRDWSRDDKDGRFIYIMISKTKKKNAADSYIRVPESLPVVHSGFGFSTIGEIIRHCTKGSLSQYLVFKMPERQRSNWSSMEKEHPWQLAPKDISMGFAEARDKTGLYDHLPSDQRPGFHKLLNLGQYFRKQQGWTTEQISNLRGHGSISTTDIYLEGHNWKTIEIPKTE